jgi:hypothetical protein
LNTDLVVDDILLGQYVDHLPVHGDGHRPGRIDHPVHILLGDFLPFDGNDPSAVETGDVATGNPA